MGAEPQQREARQREALRALGLRGSPRVGLAYATLGFFAGIAVVSLFGPAALHFSKAMRLSGVELGLLVAAPQLTGSLLRIPFGAWVEVGGGRRPMLVLLTLSLVGMLGLLQLLHSGPLTEDQYPTLLCLAALCGCGAASFAVAIPQVAYWFPTSQQGRALGLCAGIGNLSPGCFALILPAAIATLGLANAYLAWFLFLALATGVYALRSRDAFSFQLRARGASHESAARLSRELGQQLQPSGAIWLSLRQAATQSHTWALVALYFSSFGGFLALVVWLPSYWTAIHAVGALEAGALTAVVFALPCSLVRTYGGSLSDRVGGERVAMASFGTASVAAALMMVTSSFAGASCALLVMGLAMGIANAAVFKLVPQFVPTAVGAASGWVGGVGAFGGFVIPPLLGLLVDVSGSSGYPRGFSIFLLLSLGSTLLVYRRFGSGEASRRAAAGDSLALDAS